MDPGSDLETDGPQPVDRRDGALDRRRRPAEDGEHAVSGRVDDASAIGTDDAPHDLVMPSKQAPPRGVAQLRRELARTDDVGEQHREERMLAFARCHVSKRSPGEVPSFALSRTDIADVSGATRATRSLGPDD